MTGTLFRQSFFDHDFAPSLLFVPSTPLRNLFSVLPCLRGECSSLPVVPENRIDEDTHGVVSYLQRYNLRLEE